MKEKFLKKIGEGGRAIWEIRLFSLLLNTIICFLAFSVLLTIAGASITYGLLPAIAYLIWAASKSAMKSDIVATIEEKHDKLKWKLKTAYDNRNKDDNVIVEDLLDDSAKEMDNVETSVFLDSRKVSLKVLMSIVLIFLMLSITVIDFRGMASGLIDLDSLLRDIDEAMKEHGIEYETIIGGEDRWETQNLTTDKEEEKLGADPGGERPGFNMGPIPGTGGGVGSDDSREIYGEASVAVIEGEDVELNLRPDYGGEIEINDETGDEEYVVITGPGGAEAAETCEECAIGPEYEELVKRYFEKMLGEA